MGRQRTNQAGLGRLSPLPRRGGAGPGTVGLGHRCTAGPVAVPGVLDVLDDTGCPSADWKAVFMERHNDLLEPILANLSVDVGIGAVPKVCGDRARILLVKLFLRRPEFDVVRLGVDPVDAAVDQDQRIDVREAPDVLLVLEDELDAFLDVRVRFTGHANHPVDLRVDAGLPAVLQVLGDHLYGVALLLQAERVLGERVHAEPKCHKTGLMELVVEGPIALFVDAQLSGKLDVQFTANDFVADLQHLLGHAVEIAFVKHEQGATLLDQPLQFIDKFLRVPDAPVKPLGAEGAARPPAASAGDNGGQLIVVVIAINVQVEPLVFWGLELAQIVRHRRRNEVVIPGVISG